MFTLPAVEIFSALVGGIGMTILPKFFGKTSATPLDEAKTKADLKAALLKIKEAVEKDLAAIG